MSEAELLQLFDIDELLDGIPARSNINVFHVDEKYALRIARVEGRFPEHRHPNGDEGWLVFRGRLRIDSELGSVELGAGQGALVPRGILHSPLCLEDDTIVVVINVRGLEVEPVDSEALAGAGYVERDLAVIRGTEKGTDSP